MPDRVYAVGGLASLPWGGPSQEPTVSNPTIRFTVFTKPWREPLAELARHVRKLDFDGIELPVRPGFQVEPSAVVRDLPAAALLLADEGVRIASVAGAADEATIEACALARIPLIRTLVKIPPGGQYLASTEEALRQIERLTPCLQQAGVCLGIQNHCYREISSVMGLRELVRRFDPNQVAAVLDVGHCGLAGELPDLALDAVWSHLRLVNFKNACWQLIASSDGAPAQYQCVFTPGREGMAHWPTFARELRQRGYRGDICLTAEYSDSRQPGQPRRESDLVHYAPGLEYDRDPQRFEQLLRQDLAFARSLFAIA